MKTFQTLLILLLVHLAAAPDILRAEEKSITTEAFGKISLGSKAAALVKLLGEAEAKGKDTLWDATGDWVQEWNYPAKGLTLAMASTKKGGAKTLLSLTATIPCDLATARGIKIGSSEADVRKAYGKIEDKESSVAGENFVAGSIYDGVMFTFKKGKVVQIFIGAAAE